MIAMTPDIMGPGIEEEYADASAAIANLRQALGARLLTNDTPDGRLLLETAALEQEIKRRRLPIPVDESYARTVYYLVGSNELPHVRGIIDPAAAGDALGRLYLVLHGYGLLKPRHIPVVISMIDDLCDEATLVWNRILPEERASMDDIRAEGEVIRKGGWPAPRKPQDQFPIANTPNLKTLIDNFRNKARRISLSIYDGWRPYPASKGPLAAPVPGLPAQAPPLPASLAGRLP